MENRLYNLGIKIDQSGGRESIFLICHIEVPYKLENYKIETVIKYQIEKIKDLDPQTLDDWIDPLCSELEKALGANVYVSTPNSIITITADQTDPTVNDYRHYIR